MKVFNGRPQSTEGRPEKEIRFYDLLDSLKIEYSRVDHAPADDMAICEEISKNLGASICKNLFLCNRQKTNFYLLMMPADKPFKTKDITSQINSARLSFASSEDMEKYLDITPGSVSVAGLMNDKENIVTLLVDEDILKDEYVGIHPLINTSSLKIKTDDIFNVMLSAINHTMTVVNLP